MQGYLAKKVKLDHSLFYFKFILLALFSTNQSFQRNLECLDWLRQKEPYPVQQ